jgi:hypothetical protein
MLFFLVLYILPENWSIYKQVHHLSKDIKKKSTQIFELYIQNVYIMRKLANI